MWENGSGSSIENFLILKLFFSEIYLLHLIHPYPGSHNIADQADPVCKHLLHVNV